ncbi:branched-chain amino acid ABC transporter permease [Noviherbaspirillum denitrificans]|uniref:ABC transporter permease n=1 Tax=Noviherbaspirillum denitrificans TaxID=1968433 RepID=A0A254TND2_9BURK|nr:branched-chain amino acid ABC transporter permease [Noviherbaspirillum denitrificans]OWW21218.1 ABC transporter permease [Noviherbaspirillum denitrificans]
MRDQKTVIALLCAAAVLAAPLVSYPIFLIKVLCFALFAIAFNLALGISGLLSFGHAAFFGGAGYVAAAVARDWSFSFEAAIAAGAAYAAVLGLAFGALAVRRKGIYFAMITLALAQLAYFAIFQTRYFGGEDGFQGVPRPALLGIVSLDSDLVLYYVVLAVVCALSFFTWRLIHSPMGLVLASIRESENRATSVGYEVDHYKVFLFAVSAALAGVAGSMKAITLGFATLTDIDWRMSGTVVLMVLVGGIRSWYAPALGALVILAVENKVGELGVWLARTTDIAWFGTLGDSVTIITGLIFLLCVQLFRDGVSGLLKSLRLALPAPGMRLIDKEVN